MSRVHALKDWISVNPTVKSWHAKKALKSTRTADIYANDLFTYWKYLNQARGFKVIDQWVEDVSQQQRSPEFKTRVTWGKELEDFVLAYHNPRTKASLGIGARKVLVASVKSYLVFNLGEVSDYDFTFGTHTEVIAEIRKRETQAPLTFDEIKRLINAAKSQRDKTILLTMMPGMGDSEFLQFASEWHSYEESIRNKIVPLKFSVTRPKTERTYWGLQWDDAVDALHDLLEERERDMGRKLSKSDLLFVQTSGKPITAPRIMEMVRDLAERSGVEPRVKGQLSYRVRPHELGRDFYRTLLENLEVPESIAEFSIGHKIDPLEYNKFQRTKEGEERILKQLTKARPFLNVITGRGKNVDSASSYLDEAAYFIALFRLKDAGKVGEVKNLIVEEVFGKHSEAYEKRRKEWLTSRAAQTITADPIAIVSRMTRDELLPAVVNIAAKLEKQTAQTEYEYKAVDVNTPSELQRYYDEGWEYVGGFNSHGVSLKRLKRNA